MPWTLVITTNQVPVILSISQETLATDVIAAKEGTGDLIKTYEEQSMGDIQLNLTEVVYTRPFDVV